LSNAFQWREKFEVGRSTFIGVLHIKQLAAKVRVIQRTCTRVSSPYATFFLRARRIGWYTIDWANSAFSTSVVTVFLGPYLTSVAMTTATDGMIAPFGVAYARWSSWFSFCISLSVLLQVVVLPVVGALVDRSHRKRLDVGTHPRSAERQQRWVCSHALPKQATMHLAVHSFIIANVFFGASVVVANAFTATASLHFEERDAVSSRGWALGYLGGAILLSAHLVWYNTAAPSSTHRAKYLGERWVVVGAMDDCSVCDASRHAGRRRTAIDSNANAVYTSMDDVPRSNANSSAHSAIYYRLHSV
jgi:hypothetical protein